MDLTKKVVVVTGGAKGIGAALCRRFHTEGARVVVVADLDQAEADNVAKEISGYAVGCNVSLESEVQQLVEETLQKYGAIDLFCSNAGILTLGDETVANEVWERTWQVNVMGTLEMVMAVQRHTPDCHFVYISSAEVYGRTAFSGNPVMEEMALQPANPYAASKAAADLLVREAAMRGLFATLVRPVNHTGPGQDDRFVIPAVCSQISRI